MSTNKEKYEWRNEINIRHFRDQILPYWYSAVIHAIPLIILIIVTLTAVYLFSSSP